MPLISPVGFRYFRDVYNRGQLTIINVFVTIDGQSISGSASILAVNTALGENYEDLIVDFLVTFNAPNAGTLQRISISIQGPTVKGNLLYFHFCSMENMTVPSGTVRVTKRFIIRWYTK